MECMHLCRLIIASHALEETLCSAHQILQCLPPPPPQPHLRQRSLCQARQLRAVPLVLHCILAGGEVQSAASARPKAAACVCPVHVSQDFSSTFRSLLSEGTWHSAFGHNKIATLGTWRRKSSFRYCMSKSELLCTACWFTALASHRVQMAVA